MSDEATGDEAFAAKSAESGEEELKWPIGFITILVLVVLYLGWRLIQGLGWVLDQIA